MAAVVFGEGKFQQAQDLYGEALRLHPHQAGAAVRVGFGLASYQLGQVDRAKAAFQRALQLDPENVSAMVATAILTFASLDVSFPNYARETERAMKLMSMAHLLDHSNAMVQNHLANHYFYKWTPLPGTVSVQKGSVTVMPSQPIPLDAGESIRVGMHFETNVQDEANDDNSFIMKDAWTLESNGMLLCMRCAILDDSSILTFIDQTTSSCGKRITIALVPLRRVPTAPPWLLKCRLNLSFSSDAFIMFVMSSKVPSSFTRRLANWHLT
jgi:hypothetical protein